MRTVDIVICNLITISTGYSRTLDALELRQLRESAQHIHHIRIWENLLAHLQQITQILDSRRNTLYEVLLALEIATESIGTQHLQSTEEHKETQAMHEMTHRWYLGIVFQRLIVLPYQLAAEIEGILG